MIKIYYVENETEGLTEKNWWGDIIDGNVATSIEDNGPADTTLEKYVDTIDTQLLSGIIDPVAVTEKLQYGPIRAAIPSEENPSNLYTGEDGDSIIVDGKLNTVEKHEANKYVSRKSEDNAILYKDYEMSNDFNVIVISQRTKTDTTELARINIATNEVTKIKDGKENQAKTHINYLLEQTPILNPVAVTQENNKSRITGVIDPNTQNNEEKLVTDPKEIKKNPNKIKNNVSSSPP